MSRRRRPAASSSSAPPRGEADHYSDLDLLLYYDSPPADERLAAARAKLGIDEHTEIFGRTEDGASETYRLDGVQCQLGHESIAGVEREIDRVVVDLDPTEEHMKILMGLEEGVPLYGKEVVAALRVRARYSDELQRAVLERSWKFFPLWYFEPRFAVHDAVLWRYDVLVQSVYSLLGVVLKLKI